jgi:hypothetical protein
MYSLERDLNFHDSMHDSNLDRAVQALADLVNIRQIDTHEDLEDFADAVDEVADEWNISPSELRNAL